MTEPRKMICGHCLHWTALNKADPTAGEGKCTRENNPGHRPHGYWPATLRRDACARGYRHDTSKPTVPGAEMFQC